VRSIQLRPLLVSNVGMSDASFVIRRSLVVMNFSSALPLAFVHVSDHNLFLALLSIASIIPSPFVSCKMSSIVCKFLSMSWSMGRYRLAQ